MNHKPYTLDNAIRDICSVSVTAAPKSTVRKILKKLLASHDKKLCDKIDKEKSETKEKIKDLYFSSDDDLYNAGLSRAKEVITGK